MRILPVNNYQKSSNQTNFEAKMFRIKQSNGSEIAISGELLGRVAKKLWKDEEAVKLASWDISLSEAGTNTIIYTASIPERFKTMADNFYTNLVKKVGEARHMSGEDEVVFNERLEIPRENLP